MCSDSNLEIVKAHIASYPDFPKPGILFRDIFPIFQSPLAMTALESLLVEHVKTLPKVDAVLVLESRGFLLGPLISIKLQLPLVPVRKKGKLPGKIKRMEYTLEYGEDAVEMQENSVMPGQKVIIVDDLIATGGTAKAACDLVKQMGGDVSELLVLMELKELGGRDIIPCNVHSFVQF